MTFRQAVVVCDGIDAGLLEECPEGYCFRYLPEYVATGGSAISLTLPVRAQPYVSETLFAFFFGLLAEGNLKELQCQIARLDPNDHFGRLLATAAFDVIGNVQIRNYDQ